MPQDTAHTANEEEVLNLQDELEETEQNLKEVTLMIEQSQREVMKLTQRNAAITSHLQQMQADAEKASFEEIKLAYDSALDAQQRLFVMRGQLEKLQSDKIHLERYKKLLTHAMTQQEKGVGASSESGGQGGRLESVEMVVNAQEAERQRLSRQMHDGPAQALSNFILQTEIAMRLLDVDAEQARDELRSLKGAAMKTFQQVRNFIFELRPMMLDDLGLVPTIRRYIENFKDQTGLDVNLNISGTERRLESYLEVMTFRALQELLGNAMRHSQATVIKVHVDVGEDSIRVTVDDNGKGFDTDILRQKGNLGLKLIKDRAEMLGGDFQIDSTIGKGTRVTFSVPAATP